MYRAIDSAGAMIDFLLLKLRDADAAKQLFRKALRNLSHPPPRVINTDLAPIGGGHPRPKEGRTLRRRCRYPSITESRRISRWTPMRQWFSLD